MPRLKQPSKPWRTQIHFGLVSIFTENKPEGATYLHFDGTKIPIVFNDYSEALSYATALCSHCTTE